MRRAEPQQLSSRCSGLFRLCEDLDSYVIDPAATAMEDFYFVGLLLGGLSVVWSSH